MTDAASDQLQVLVETDGAATVLRVIGEVDLLTAPILAEAVDRSIADGATEIVIDCLEVTYLGSTGIGVLVRAWREMHDRATLHVAPNLQPHVRRVLELCGLSELTTDMTGPLTPAREEPAPPPPDTGATPA